MSICQMALSKGVRAFVLCVNQSVNIAPRACKQGPFFFPPWYPPSHRAAGISPQELAAALNCKRCAPPPPPPPSLLICSNRPG